MKFDMNSYRRQCAIDRAKSLFQTMTDYRWYSRGLLSWEAYQQRLAIETVRYKARMYEIVTLGISS